MTSFYSISIRMECSDGQVRHSPHPRVTTGLEHGEFYIDTCLTFSLRSAPSSLTNWPMLFTGPSNTTMVWAILDNFFTAGSLECSNYLQAMFSLCTTIKTSKIDGPPTTLTFLGIVNWGSDCWYLTREKGRPHPITSVTKGQMQQTPTFSLVEKLSFVCKVILAG